MVKMSNMKKVVTLPDLKEKFQAIFEDNEESLKIFGMTYTPQIKAYLIENNNCTPDDAKCPLGFWKRIESTDWYTNYHVTQDQNLSDTFFLDTSRQRIWILYSLLDVNQSDFLVKNWINNKLGLDRCWLTRNHLLHWDYPDSSWKQRGVGIKFSDGLYPEDEAANFSLKAWYGASRKIPQLVSVIDQAKENFAIHSVRWQKSNESSVTLSEEWYSQGKVTINRGTDTDEALLSIGEMATLYLQSIKDADKLKVSSLGAFELNFSQEIDINSFSTVVSKGIGDMRLWLVETETDGDFKRFKGVDLHTWDRIAIDVGPDYAYLTIPQKACVNAVPRIAAIQGEDNAGKISILHDGVEVFA
jgi:hypothetical protein